MSKIKILLDVVQDLRSLTDSLRRWHTPSRSRGDTDRCGQTRAGCRAQQTAAEAAPAAANNAPDAPKPPTLVKIARLRGGALHATDPPQDPRAVGRTRRGQAHRPAGKRLPRPDAGGGGAVSGMQIDHAARTHAALSASSSHRWLMCPPSVKLSEQFADKPSIYAEEGTYLHELSEMKLHRYLGDMTPEAIEAQYAEHHDNDFYSDEAENVTDEYVDFLHRDDRSCARLLPGSAHPRGTSPRFFGICAGRFWHGGSGHCGGRRAGGHRLQGRARSSHRSRPQ